MKSLLMKSALRSASCLQALSLTGLAVGAVAISAPAAAQDLTAGAIRGNVTDEAGNAVGGATVTLTSQSQGFTRTATTTGNGGFRFVGLPTGGYTVTVEAADFDTFTANDVRVLASETADLNIGLTTTGNVIVVTGAAIVQDFSGNTTGLNVDIDELMTTVPVSRDLTSVVLLAPGTSRGDDGFGDPNTGESFASISGASVAENAYYVNGLNVTNFDNYLGGADVPFDFLRTVDVKSGGYPAEFGRATGGIVNQTTKSGSNDFFAAAHAYWQPNFLRSAGKDELNCEYVPPISDANPDPEIVCSPRTNRRFDEVENRSLVLEAGGPLVKDRLFLYGLVELRKNHSLVIDRAQETAYQRETSDPFWGLKLDAYPIDGHHLEFTVFDNEATVTRSDLSYSETGGIPTIGSAAQITEFYGGGLNYVGKYTGNLTQWLTISAGYGRMRDRFDNRPITAGSEQPLFQNTSGGTVDGVSNNGFFNGQRIGTINDPYETEREFYRGDVDVYFSLFGDHHVRFGFDVENNTLARTSVRTGGEFLCNSGFLTGAACTANAGGGGAALFVRPGDVLEIDYYNSGGVFDAQNKAYYIQDEWDVTDRLTLTLGVRRDDFSVNRADGEVMVAQKENYAPRVGFSYDLFDDRRGTFYGSFGDYYLPIASNTAYRMTGSEIYFRERFEFAGVDPATGLPILGDQITNDPSYQGQCPFGLTASSSGANCAVTDDGAVAAPDATISSTLGATKVREWILGYEHAFSGVPVLGEINVGINYTNRRLQANAEDVAVDAAVLAYCEAEGIAGCGNTWTGFHQYVILNPGKDATFALDGLDGRTVTLTAEQLGYPAAVRKYDAVEITFDRPWDGVWNFGGSYTWSKSRGNSEGFVQSDFEQDDAGITQDFDQPGFTDGAFGRLPTDRRHRLKLWGAYSVFEGFTVGTNLSIESPRPLSCIGFDPRTAPADLPFTPADDTQTPYGAFGNIYGAASHFCGGELSPRGTAQKSGWIYTADLKVAYEIPVGEDGPLLRLRADVFNVFNSQGVQQRNEIGELESFSVNDNGTPADDSDDYPNYYFANPMYGVATDYQAPRTVRLGVDIVF